MSLIARFVVVPCDCGSHVIHYDDLEREDGVLCCGYCDRLLIYRDQSGRLYFASEEIRF